MNDVPEEFASTKVPMATLFVSGDISKTFGIFSVHLFSNYTSNDPAQNQIYVNDSQLSLTTFGSNVSLSLSGINLTGQGEYSIVYDYSLIGFEVVAAEGDEAAKTATGTAEGGQVNLVGTGAYSIFSWLKLSVSYQYLSRDFALISIANEAGEDVSAEYESTFFQNVYDVKTKLTYSLGVSHAF